MRTAAKSERSGPHLYKIPCWTTEVRVGVDLLVEGKCTVQ